MLIWNLIWHPGVFEKRIERNYYPWTTKDGWVGLFDLQLKMTFWACLLGSGLKLIFKSSFDSLAEAFTSWTTENNDASSAKRFALLGNLSDKSFI